MINFIIPGLYEKYDLNFKVLDFFKKNPEIIQPDAKIDSAYGNFPFCIFDGGRTFFHYEHCSKEQVERIVKQYNEYGIKIRLVFTSNQLQPKHYTDRFNNVVLDICNDSLNPEIVIADENLLEYIQSKYTNFNFISSTTKCLNNVKALKEELKNPKYFMVCLDYNLNKNMAMLENLSTEEKEKCEFLVNAICNPNCQNRKEHYRLNSLYHLNYGKPYRLKLCEIYKGNLHPDMFQQKSTILPEDIYQKYSNMGFKYYKIEGRTLSVANILIQYARYMVKPEYQFYFINTLLDTIIV